MPNGVPDKPNIQDMEPPTRPDVAVLTNTRQSFESYIPEHAANPTFATHPDIGGRDRRKL